MNNVEGKAFSSAVWKFSERILAQAISFVVSIVIARTLNPEDYSVVGLVTIFFTFSQVIISGGLNTALIQKKNADEVDYSTIFILTVIMSLAIYAILFVCAPFIGNIYKSDLLVPIIRIMGLILPINAVKSIYTAYISSRLEFRKFFFATLFGTLISGVVGIWMATHHYGSWALVAQQMTNTFFDTLILIIVTPITLKPIFSTDRLKGLWKYGWKILVTSLVNTVYSEVSPLFIGLRFNKADLSYYTKGKSFPSLLSTSCTYTISAVLFPALALYQDDTEKVRELTRRYMQIVSFIVFPIMLGIFSVADNFVIVFLTEKWLPAARFIKIFALAFLLEVVTAGNCETIKAIGRSDVFLKIEIIKKACYFVIIGVFMLLSDSAVLLAYSSIVCSIVAVIVNSIPNEKLIGYTISMLVKDIGMNLLLAIVMGVAIIGLGRVLPIGKVWSLLIQIASGIAIYFLLALVTKNQNLVFLLKSVKKKIKTGNNE